MANDRSVGLSIVIAGKDGGIGKTIGTTRTQVTGLKGQLQSLASSTGVRALATTFSVAGVVRWGKQAVGAFKGVTGEVAQFARVTGLSAEKASLLRYVAQQSGVDIKKMATAWGIFSKNIASGAVEKAGVDIRDANGELLASDEILGRVADKFAHMPDGPEKTALAMKLFGRGGADMIKILNRGSDGIAALRSEMRALGLEMSSKDLAELKKFNDAQRDLTAASTGLKVAIGGAILPLFTKLAQSAANDLPPVVHGLEAVGGAIGAVGNATGLSGVAGAVAAPLVALAVAGLGLTVAVGVMGPAVAAGSATLLGLARAAAAAGLNLVVPTAATTGLGAAEVTTTTATTGLTAALTAEAGALGLVQTALLGVAAGFVSYNVAYGKLEGLSKFHGDVVQLGLDLQQAGAGVAGLGPVYDQFGGTIDSLADKIIRLREEEAKGGGDKVGELINGSALTNTLRGKQLQKELGALDSAIATLASSGHADEARAAYGKLSAALIAQGVSAEDVALVFPKTGDAIDKMAGAETKASTEIDQTTASLQGQAIHLDRTTKAVADLYAETTKVRGLQEAVTQAHEDTTAALADKAAAEKAATGDSEEYRQASDDVAAAVEGVADAERGVADARREQRSAAGAVLDAQEKLNKAYADARERIDAMAESAREARDDEADAIQTAREKAEANRLAQGNTQLSQLEKDRAALDAKDAADEAADKGREATKAERDAAAAARAGVAGDADVIAAQKQVADAKQGVVEANQRVVDAERAVRDAQAEVTAATGRQRQVLVDAKAAVVEAAKKAEDAILNEGSAWADLATEQNGAIAGIQTYLSLLETYRQKVAPGSQMYNDISAFMALLRGDLTPTNSTGQASLGPSAPPGAQNAERQSRGVTNNITVTTNGTPQQQRRALTDTAKDVADKIAKGGM